jgi:hypothetical protein
MEDLMDKEAKEEDFEKSFDEATVETDGKKVETEEKEEVDTKDTKTVDTKVAKPEEGVDEKDKKEEVKPTYEELEQKHKSLQGMFKKTSEDFEELKKAKVEKVEEKPEVKPKPKEEVEEVVDEELETYLKEYNYIAKNQEKLTTKALKKVLSDFAEGFKKELTEKYDITIKGAEKLISEKQKEDFEIHIGTIMEAHGDYGTKEEKENGKKTFCKADVESWIDTLSPIRKREYGAILEDGNTEEVVDLLTVYKEVNGITKKEEKEEVDDKEKEEKENLKNKKLEELETVKSKKSPVSGSLKKVEDFDGAYDEAVKAQK